MSQYDPLLTLAGRLTAQRLADTSVFERIIVNDGKEQRINRRPLTEDPFS